MLKLQLFLVNKLISYNAIPIKVVYNIMLAYMLCSCHKNKLNVTLFHTLIKNLIPCFG